MKNLIIICFVLSLICVGCAAFKQQSASDTPPPAKTQGFNQQFYGFPDIPVPKEVEIVNERSFVYETSSFKAGVIVFSGNVDPASLETYFKINMPKNGWRYVNSFRYKDIVLNYVKDDKTCNIKISRGAFLTELEVWVGPVDRGGMPKPGPTNGTK